VATGLSSEDETSGEEMAHGTSHRASQKSARDAVTRAAPSIIRSVHDDDDEEDSMMSSSDADDDLHTKLQDRRPVPAVSKKEGHNNGGHKSPGSGRIKQIKKASGMVHNPSTKGSAALGSALQLYSELKKRRQRRKAKGSAGSRKEI
jgi:hypothetical protein